LLPLVSTSLLQLPSAIAMNSSRHWLPLSLSDALIQSFNV
jgi:hypothetical protein